MKKRRRVFFLFSITLLFAFCTFFVSLSRADASSHYMDSLGIVKFDNKLKAPDFTLKDVTGKKVSLQDYRGKIVFLNFWATWCPPCRVEMPSMERLYSEFKDKDFAMLAIDLQEAASTVKDFGEQLGLSYPLLLDSDGSVGVAYGVRSIPATYLVDRQGYLIGGALGPRDWASHESFRLINHPLTGLT